MKAIINGTRYDTDKAELLGEATANLPRGDFAWFCAGLYRTPRSGRYFLAGRGGPASMFRRTVDQNSWTGGERVIPMDEDEAFEWAQQVFRYGAYVRAKDHPEMRSNPHVTDPMDLYLIDGAQAIELAFPHMIEDA